MKKGLNTQGFTIVEVMIVLAVTGALLIMALVLISGQQGKTQFSQSINDIQAQINDVVNNVATGYYANNGNVSCTSTGGVPQPTVGAAGEGQNTGCVFLGRAIQFDVGGDKTAYNIYDIVGTQKTASGNYPANKVEAAPVVLAPPSSTADTTSKLNLLYGLEVGSMKYQGGDISSIAFLSSFANYTNNDLNSGSQHVSLYPIKTSATIASGGETAPSAVPKITAANMDDPGNGVQICFNSQVGNQSGTITIGGNGGQLATTLKIQNTNCT